MTRRVQRFRSLEEMGAAPVVNSGAESGFERFARQCARYYALARPVFPRGVFRFRSLGEGQAARARITEENLRRRRLGDTAVPKGG